jgi:hypothetical protein
MPWLATCWRISAATRASSGPNDGCAERDLEPTVGARSSISFSAERGGPELWPRGVDAWLHKVSLARAVGDETLAATCEAQAATIATSDVPFGIPASRLVSC